MVDRRRSPRFVLRTPLEGRLRFAREVVVEHYDGEEIAVRSSEAGRQNEVLHLDDLSLAPPLSLAVRVHESKPTLVEGDVVHHVRLRPAGPDTVLNRPDIRASLAREFPVVVTELCRNGCLLLTETPVEPGEVGELVLVIEGRISSGVVQVRRCQPVAGRGRACRAGVEFVTRGRRGNSLPLAVDRMADDEEWRMVEPSPTGK